MDQCDSIYVIKFQINVVFLKHSIHQRNLEKKMYHSFHKKYSTLIIISVFWAANHLIKMISEGSCDTEDHHWNISKKQFQ